MADGYRRDEEQLRRAYELIRRRFWLTTAVAVALGVAIAVGSTGFAGRLEATARERYAEVLRNRQELRRLSGRIVSAQEEERRAIARELHDEIGQALTAVDCQLSLAQRDLGNLDQPAAALTDARTVTEQALRSVRDLSQLLRPSMLDDFGLPDTLKWSLERFSARTGIRTRLIEEGLSERLPGEVELCAYRTVQEALTNVARHAHATSCQVYVQRLASSLLVTVEDDGVGLQAVRTENERQRDGVGLLGIRERVASLSGSFQIDGSSRAGTRLTIELPLASGA
jgi:signal transduction histidine kinase